MRVPPQNTACGWLPLTPHPLGNRLRRLRAGKHCHVGVWSHLWGACVRTNPCETYRIADGLRQAADIVRSSAARSLAIALQRKVVQDPLQDSTGGAAIAVGVVGLCHARIGILVIQQRCNLLHDALSVVGTD